MTHAHWYGDPPLPIEILSGGDLHLLIVFLCIYSTISGVPRPWRIRNETMITLICTSAMTRIAQKRYSYVEYLHPLLRVSVNFLKLFTPRKYKRQVSSSNSFWCFLLFAKFVFFTCLLSFFLLTCLLSGRGGSCWLLACLLPFSYPRVKGATWQSKAAAPSHPEQGKGSDNSGASSRRNSRVEQRRAYTSKAGGLASAEQGCVKQEGHEATRRS